MTAARVATASRTTAARVETVIRETTAVARTTAAARTARAATPTVPTARHRPRTVAVRAAEGTKDRANGTRPPSSTHKDRIKWHLKLLDFSTRAEVRRFCCLVQFATLWATNKTVVARTRTGAAGAESPRHKKSKEHGCFSRSRTLDKDKEEVVG